MDRFGERVLVTMSGFLLFGVATVYDDGLRSRVTNIVRGGALNELTIAGQSVQGILERAFEAAGYQGAEHGSLTFFVITAAALFAVMLRI